MSALLALAIIDPRCVAAAEVMGRVVAVESGDTLRLAGGDNREFTVRLTDIGAPFGGAFYASSARQLLSNMVRNETVRVVVTGRGASDRVFGRVYRGPLNVNLELVKAGAAWLCIEFARDTAYLPYQNQAIRLRLGVWSRTTTFDARLACQARPPALRP